MAGDEAPVNVAELVKVEPIRSHVSHRDQVEIADALVESATDRRTCQVQPDEAMPERADEIVAQRVEKRT
jgi:hypothetical protein